jgi:hypothetical protein
VTLYYENAWRDNAQKRWVDAHFHLLDELVQYFNRLEVIAVVWLQKGGESR